MAKQAAVITAIIFILLTSSPTNAAIDATSEIPELNPLCWTEKDCNGIRSKNFGADSGDGWLKGEDPCNKSGWGKCLPAGKSKTEISFGGKTEFANVGEFIIFMYRYLLAIASILAVIVIIVSGVQWTASGGNSEMISSSKKRIGGAVIGLFIAYGSFFILNVINPALVNLRLPQVFLIKPQELMPEFCGDVEGSKDGTTKFMLAADTDNQKEPITPGNAIGKKNGDGYKWNYKESPGMFWCGKRFFAENGGSTSCRGDFCAPTEKGASQMCIEKDDRGHGCVEANVAGTIINTDLLAGGAPSAVLTEEWDSPPVTGIELMAYCNKKFTKVDAKWDNMFYRGAEQIKGLFTSEDDDDKIIMADGGMLIGTADGHNFSDKQVYRIKAKSNRLGKILLFCGEWEGLKGFVLRVWMSEAADPTNEIHYIGRGGIDLGDKCRGVCDGFFDKNAYKINSKYFFTLEEIVGKGGRDPSPDQVFAIDELKKLKESLKGVPGGSGLFDDIDATIALIMVSPDPPKGALRVNFNASDITDIDSLDPIIGERGREVYNYLLQ